MQAIRWKDSSKIVTFLTETDGLVKLIVRGAYRKNSPLAGRLETLNEVRLVYYKKSSRDLQMMKEIDLVNDFSVLKTDFSRYPFALALLEALKNTLEYAHGDAVFYGFVVEMLHAIAESSVPNVPFIYFLLKLCSYLGFRPYFDNCRGNRQSACLRDMNFFSLNTGNRVCGACDAMDGALERLSRAEIFFLQNLQNERYRRLRATEYHCREWKHVVQVLLRYISVQTDRPLTLKALDLIAH